MRWPAVAALLLLGCPDEAPEVPTTPPRPALTPAPLTEVAQLSKAEGTVQVERVGRVSRVTDGPVYEGDVVMTGAASAVTLRDAEGRELELGEETRFRVGARLAVIELLEGELSVAGTGDGGLGLRTRFGTAEVALGASGRFRVGDAGLSAEVLEGGFVLFDLDAGQVDAKPGQRVELSGGGFSFFEVAPSPAPAPRATAPRLVVEVGRPLIRRAGQTKYTLAAATGELEPGTAFQVPAGASARLEVPNGTVRLSGGASGVSQGLTEVGGAPVLSLDKALGGLALLTDGKQPVGLTVGGAQVVTGAESTVLVSSVGKKTRVDVRAGEAVVTVNGAPTTVRVGEGLLIEQGRAVPAPASRAGLPVGAGRVRVHGDVKDVVVALPNEVNRVEVSREPDFARPLVKGVVGKQLALPGGRGSVHYRVLDDGGKPTQQGRVDFLPDVASARDTTTRSDTVSETGQRATVFYQSKVPALTFAFAAQSDTKSWRFQLFASDLGKPVVDRTVSEPKVLLEPGILAEGDFLWSATPLDAAGTAKAGARMNKLSVVYDNARTSLLIERPLPNERATASTQAVGVAPRASSLFINGKPVKVDEAGRFAVTVGAVDTVTFRVITQEGDGLWVRRLKK